jgi:hypothetical protein
VDVAFIGDIQAAQVSGIPIGMMYTATERTTLQGIHATGNLRRQVGTLRGSRWLVARYVGGQASDNAAEIKFVRFQIIGLTH